MHKCKKCGIKFTRKCSYDRHFKLKHKKGSKVATFVGNIYKCSSCSHVSETRSNLKAHVKSHHQDSLKYVKTSALQDKVCIYRKNLSGEDYSLPDFCSSTETVKDICDVLKFELQNKVVFYVSLAIVANYELSDLAENKNIDSDSFCLRTKKVNLNEFESDEWLKAKIGQMLRSALARENDLLTRGSGWRFDSLQCCDILIYDVNFVTYKLNSTIDLIDKNTKDIHKAIK